MKQLHHKFFFEIEIKSKKDIDMFLKIIKLAKGMISHKNIYYLEPKQK